MARTRGLSRRCFSAIAVDENSAKLTPQLLHRMEVSGEVALHFEQVCTGTLLILFFQLYRIKIKKRELKPALFIDIARIPSD
jgi:hypothetical protein